MIPDERTRDADEPRSDASVEIEGGWPVLIAGYAAYTGERLGPRARRLRGIQRAHEGRQQLEKGDPEAEATLRAAIEDLVEAFLHDRRGNADLFAQAHELGETVERAFGCFWSLDAKREVWEDSCPVLALHNRLGMSWAGPSWGRCSICDAEDFGCDHVPGRMYDGVPCQRVVYRADPEEISLTPHPDDPSCYRVHFPKSVAEVEALRGRPLRPGERPICTHCADCRGHEGPTEEDLDPSTWPSLPTG